MILNLDADVSATVSCLTSEVCGGILIVILQF